MSVSQIQRIPQWVYLWDSSKTEKQEPYSYVYDIPNLTSGYIFVEVVHFGLWITEKKNLFKNSDLKVSSGKEEVSIIYHFVKNVLALQIQDMVTMD